MGHFQVSQTLNLAVPKEKIPIEHYLRQPQRLVQAITDPSRIEQLAPAHFRLQLRPLQFMMLQLQPQVDLKVWTQGEGTLHLQSLSCEIRGAEYLQRSFSLDLAGKLWPHRLSNVTQLQGRADLRVKVDVPPPLKLLPEPVLQKSGRAFLNGILLTIKYRLERQLIQDYRRWVKTSSTKLRPPTAMPLGSPAS